MSQVYIYLDESGDLGWILDKPYLSGGSSKYLTIASLSVDSAIRHLPKRIIRDLYTRFKWNREKEKKWSRMNNLQRIEFARLAHKLVVNSAGKIQCHSITVKKVNVEAHIRTDPNKLYNYMISCSLLNLMSQHDEVIFVPDPRSIKVASGNSMHDYLGMKLWFDKKVHTGLLTKPADSASNLNIQFADMLAGLVQNHFESGNSDPWNILCNFINFKRLYF